MPRLRLLLLFIVVFVLFAMPSWGAKFRRQTSVKKNEDFLSLCQTGTPEEIRQYVLSMDRNINTKAKVNIVVGGNKRKKEITPLMAAAMMNTDPEVINVLVNAGADINAVNINGATALMLAAEVNTNPAVIDALIEAGAEDLVDEAGKNALMYAVLNSNSGIVKALIEAGSDVNDNDNEGTTALMLAAEMNTNPEVIEILLDAGAEDFQDKNGANALCYAIRTSNTEAVKILINAGTNVNIDGEGGWRPLSLAAITWNSLQHRSGKYGNLDEKTRTERLRGNIKIINMLKQAGAQEKAQAPMMRILKVGAR